MYIVIEIFDKSFPSIVCDPEKGMPVIFTSEKKAIEEADLCQDGLVVEI
jgi:hypothetical protein